MDNITHLKSAYEDIKIRMNLFFDFLEAHGRLSHALVHTLPTTTNEDVAQHVSQISVDNIKGHEAASLCRSHYLSMKLDQHRSGRILKRLPGIVQWKHPQPEECMGRLQDINKAKDDFKQLIQGLDEDKDVRFEIFMRALPDVVKLQATRHMLFTDKPLFSASLNWANRHSMKRLTRFEVLKKLEETLTYYERHEAWSDKADLIRKEIKIASHYDKDTPFVIRRPLRVTPQMTLSFEDRDANTVGMIAHSPLLVFSSVKKIHALEDYKPSSKASQERRYESVIPRLHLFRDCNKETANV